MAERDGDVADRVGNTVGSSDSDQPRSERDWRWVGETSSGSRETVPCADSNQNVVNGNWEGAFTSVGGRGEMLVRIDGVTHHPLDSGDHKWNNHFSSLN